MFGQNNAGREDPLKGVKQAAEGVVHQGHRVADSATEGARHLEKQAENAVGSGPFGGKTHGGAGDAAHDAKRTVENKTEEVSHRAQETMDAGGRKAGDVAHSNQETSSGIVENVKGAVGGTFESAKDGAINVKEKVFGK